MIRMDKSEQDEQAVNWGVPTFTLEIDSPNASVKAVIAVPSSAWSLCVSPHCSLLTER